MTARARDPQDASGPAGLTPDVERRTGAPAAGSREAMDALQKIAALAWGNRDEAVTAIRDAQLIALYALDHAPASGEVAEPAPEGDVERVVRALGDLLKCHAEGGFVEPDSEVLDEARAALAALRGAPAASGTPIDPLLAAIVARWDRFDAALVDQDGSYKDGTQRFFFKDTPVAWSAYHALDESVDRLRDRLIGEPPAAPGPGR